MRRIHIAGSLIEVGPRVRQLCGWCGERLIDMDLRTVDVHPPPAPGERVIKGWKPGCLVAHDGPAWTVVAHVDGEQLPPGWCGDEGPILVALPGGVAASNAEGEED